MLVILNVNVGIAIYESSAFQIGNKATKTALRTIGLNEDFNMFHPLN